MSGGLFERSASYPLSLPPDPASSRSLHSYETDLQERASNLFTTSDSYCEVEIRQYTGCTVIHDEMSVLTTGGERQELPPSETSDVVTGLQTLRITTSEGLNAVLEVNHTVAGACYIMQGC